MQARKPIVVPASRLIEVPDDIPVGTVVEIRPVGQATPAPLPERGRGIFKGKMWMADDFDAPLPDDVLDAIEAPIDDGAR